MAEYSCNIYDNNNILLWTIKSERYNDYVLDLIEKEWIQAPYIEWWTFGGRCWIDDEFGWSVNDITPTTPIANFNRGNIYALVTYDLTKEDKPLIRAKEIRNNWDSIIVSWNIKRWDISWNISDNQALSNSFNAKVTWYNKTINISKSKPSQYTNNNTITFVYWTNSDNWVYVWPTKIAS